MPLDSSPGSSPSPPLAVGDLAPDFTLPGAGEVPVNLATFRGRKVALYFYPKDDTSGCTREARDFQALRDAFRAADTEVVGVSPDPVRSHDRFRTKYALDFPLASDEGRAVLEAYGVWVQKSMYGRKYMGVERTTVLIGRDGRVARVWPKVSVPGHAQEVLEAARAI